MPTIQKIFQRSIGCGLLLTVATAVLATAMPSTLRSLTDSYQALRTGMSVNTALELMGNPKNRIESSWLGLRYTQLSWVDIGQTQYEAKFVSDALVHKSATSGSAE